MSAVVLNAAVVTRLNNSEVSSSVWKTVFIDECK